MSAPSNLCDPLSLQYKSMSHSCCLKLVNGYPCLWGSFRIWIASISSVATIHLFPIRNTLTHLMLEQFGIYCFSDYIMGLGNSFVSFDYLFHFNTISATWKICTHLEYPTETLLCKTFLHHPYLPLVNHPFLSTPSLPLLMHTWHYLIICSHEYPFYPIVSLLTE